MSLIDTFFINSLNNADFIILSTGSLYTSIIPNLVISEVYESLKKSKAKKCSHYLSIYLKQKKCYFLVNAF